MRALNQTRLILEYNAGFTGAMAAMVEAPGSWEICLQVRAAAELIPGCVPSPATPGLQLCCGAYNYFLTQECIDIVGEVICRGLSRHLSIVFLALQGYSVLVKDTTIC